MNQQDHDQPQQWPTWTGPILVLAALLAGTVVRISVAWPSEIWVDEANSVLLAITPLSELADALRLDSSPPLYYILLKIWIHLFSFEPMILRALSLTFGCLSIIIFYFVGTRLDRPATGLIASWLLAIHPLHVYYSEEIRMYSLLFLLGLAFYFVVFDRLRHRGAMFLAVVTGSLLCYTHYYGVIYVATCLAGLLILEPKVRYKTLICAGLIAMAFVPWMPVFLDQLRNAEHIQWIAIFWEHYPRGAAIFRTLQTFLPGGSKPKFLPMEGLTSLQLPIIALGLFPIVIWYWRDGQRHDHLKIPIGILAMMLGALIAFSYVKQPIYLVGRSDIVVLPLFILVLAVLLSRSGRLIAVVYIVIWSLLGGIELVANAKSLRKEGNTAIITAIEKHNCDTVITTGLSYAPIRYHQLRTRTPWNLQSYPIDLKHHPGNFEPSTYNPEQFFHDTAILFDENGGVDRVCIAAEKAPYTKPLVETFWTGRRSTVEHGLKTSVLQEDYALVVIESDSAVNQEATP